MKTSKVLKAALNELETNANVISTDLSKWPRSTRPGMESKMAQAKVNHPTLTANYKKALPPHVAKILVTGNKELAEFTDLMVKNKSFVYSANYFYALCSTYLEPLLRYNGPFTTGAFLKLHNMVDNVAVGFSIVPKFLREPLGVSVKDFDELVVIVKNIIEEGYGYSLNAKVLSGNFEDDALSTRFNKEICLLTVTDLTEDERKYLSDNLYKDQPSFAVDLTESDNEDTIKAFAAKLYKQVYSTFKKLGKVE